MQASSHLHISATRDELIEIFQQAILTRAVHAKLSGDAPDGFLFDGNAWELAVTCVNSLEKLDQQPTTSSGD
jgi:hypothetical protein